MRLRTRVKNSANNSHQVVDLTLPDDGAQLLWGDLNDALLDKLGPGLRIYQFNVGRIPIPDDKSVAIPARTDTLSSLGVNNGETLSITVTDKELPPIPQEGSTQPNDLAGSLDMTMEVEVMDDDNSCLFSAIAYLLCGDRGLASDMRTLIADLLKSQQGKDNAQYSEAALGKSLPDYIEWIQKPNSWGGGIELALFAQHFETEIASVDVSTQRVDLFQAEVGNSWKQRVYVLYSGIHYDALVLRKKSLNEVAKSSQDHSTTRIFSLSDDSHPSSVNSEYDIDSIHRMAISVAKNAFVAHKFTDTANFTLSCGICNAPLVGEAEAREHAAQTGHQHFTEYRGK